MMQNKDNDKEQPLDELPSLRRRVDELEELVTAHKQVLDALFQSEERYRSYIEVTGQMGWITNADGEVEEDIRRAGHASRLHYATATERLCHGRARKTVVPHELPSRRI